MNLNEKSQFPSLTLIFELTKEKLHFQSEQWNAVDSKNAIVLAVYGIVLAIYTNVNATYFIVYQKYILAFWLCIIAIGIICSIISLIPRDIEMPPKAGVLSDKYLDKDEYDTTNVLLSTLEGAITENDYIIKRKSFYLSLSIKIFLPIALGISIISIFIKILS